MDTGSLFIGRYDSAVWTALGTWVLVIGTLAAVYWQTRQQKTINSANAIMLLHDRFESSMMKRYRRELCNSIVTKNYIRSRDDHVLIFFETIGMLTHKKVLDKEMVWNEFSWEIVRYYVALTTGKDQIQHLRAASHDNTLYSEFEWLYRCLLEIDCKIRGVTTAEAIPNSHEVFAFLSDEKALVV